MNKWEKFNGGAALIALLALLAWAFVINPVASYVTGNLANAQAALEVKGN